MPVSCCAVNCTSRKVKGCTKSFFRIPHEPERRAAWLRALKRSEIQEGRETFSPAAWTPKGHERVCSDHFISGKRSTDPADPDYVPSLFNLPASASRSTNPSAWLKFKSAKKEWNVKNKKHVGPTKQDKPVVSIDALTGNKRHAVNSIESTEKKCDDSPSKSSDYFADDVVSVGSKASPVDVNLNPFKRHPAKDLSSSDSDLDPTPPRKLPREEAKPSVKKAFSWKIPMASSVNVISSDSDSSYCASDAEDKWKRPLSYDSQLARVASSISSLPAKVASANDKSTTKGRSSDVRGSKTTGKTSTVTPEPRSAIMRGGVKIGESGLSFSSLRRDEADSQGSKNKEKRRSPKEIQGRKRQPLLKKQKELERQRKKEGKEQERGTKKKMKEMEAAKKRAEKEAIKRMRPGECLKNITTVLDRHLAESECGLRDKILTELEGTGSTVQIVDQPFPYSVTWKRTVTLHNFGEDALLGSVSTKDTEEDETLVYVPVDDFVRLVYNYKQQQQGDTCSSSKETLQSFVNGIKAHSGKKVTLLILGLQKYFTAQHQKQFRDEVQNNNVMPEDSKEKKKRRKGRKKALSFQERT
ncbi:EME1 [Branchiostoma lanceolatum]|uniref:EME1 protein n=1 Tax=Branchiostoma lanceolatum TaxID=7740 RepID=A0A8K0AGB0_BRALA|nr:EME1 [Branchiostoma lanceolatum]